MHKITNRLIAEMAKVPEENVSRVLKNTNGEPCKYYSVNTANAVMDAYIEALAKNLFLAIHRRYGRLDFKASVQLSDAGSPLKALLFIRDMEQAETLSSENISLI